MMVVMVPVILTSAGLTNAYTPQGARAGLFSNPCSFGIEETTALVQPLQLSRGFAQQACCWRLG